MTRAPDEPACCGDETFVAAMVLLSPVGKLPLLSLGPPRPNRTVAAKCMDRRTNQGLQVRYCRPCFVSPSLRTCVLPVSGLPNGVAAAGSSVRQWAGRDCHVLGESAPCAANGQDRGQRGAKTTHRRMPELGRGAERHRTPMRDRTPRPLPKGPRIARPSVGRAASSDRAGTIQRTGANWNQQQPLMNAATRPVVAHSGQAGSSRLFCTCTFARPQDEEALNSSTPHLGRQRARY